MGASLRRGACRAFRSFMLATALACTPVVVSADVVLKLAQPHPGAVGLKRAGAMAKADGLLAELVREYQAHQKAAPAADFRSRNPFLVIAHGRVLVDAGAVDDGAQLLSDLNRLGLHNGVRDGNLVSGQLPLAAIERAAALSSLRVIRASIPIRNTGSVTSQGDAVIRANEVRNGVPPYDPYDGTGVTVGVLSDSYNHYQQAGDAPDAAHDQTRLDLPQTVTVLDDGADCGGTGQPGGCTDEGRAMMQIVHDVAPGAALAFHTAFSGIPGFSQGIRDLANAGAKVIVDDVLYLAEPMFQDGAIAKAVDEVVSQRDVAYFSSAGNAGRDSYEAPYRSSSEILYVDFGFGPLPAGELHDFKAGGGPAVTRQTLTIPAGECAIVLVQWDSPFGSVSTGTGTQNDLDLWLVDDSENWILAYDAHENIPTGDPIEALQFCNDGSWVETDPARFKLLIALWDGAPPGLIKSVVFGSGSIDTDATNSGTIYGHANATGAEAVGASYWAPPLTLETYSSAGGTPILFAANGSRLSTPEIREKPEIVAPDGVNTTFFYPGSDRNGDLIPDFSGTSASAPHAAGVAALMRDAEPAASAAGVHAALESTAIDMNPETTNFDFDSGYGLIDAVAAVAAIGPAPPPPPPPAAITASFGYSCAGLDCNFTNTGSFGTGITYFWAFGDGKASELESPSNRYPAAGTYIVTQMVTRSGVPSQTATAQFRIRNRGTVSGTSSSGGDGGGGGTTTVESEKGRRKCSDGIDNDGDGLVDGADPDCAA